jgi:hypothetical protein
VSPQFEVELDKELYSAGEVVKGVVLVTEGGGSRGLKAVLEYKEEVEDYLEVATRISSGTLHSGDLTAGSSFQFELPLPEDALPNYRSEHGELYWELDVVSDEAGRDTHERRRIEVRPGERRPSEGLDEEGTPGRSRVDRADSTLGGRPSTRSRKRGRSKRERSLVRWLPYAFLAGGVVLLIVGAALLVRQVQFVTAAERATGTVVAVSRETDSDGEVTFYPVVRFTTAHGKEIEFKSSTGSKPASHSTGDRVEVLYDPDDPSDAQLSGFLDLWLGPGVLLLLGACFVGVPLALFWISRS